MDRKRRIKNITQDVREISSDINAHVGKENAMNNEEVVPAATDEVVPEAAGTPDPQVEVVVVRDSAEAEANAFNQHEAEEEARISELERLRHLSKEEIASEGISPASVPRNAASSEPDLDPETARELERRAATSPTNSFEADNGSTDAENAEADGEIVG